MVHLPMFQIWSNPFRSNTGVIQSYRQLNTVTSRYTQANKHCVHKAGQMFERWPTWEHFPASATRHIQAIISKETIIHFLSRLWYSHRAFLMELCGWAPNWESRPQFHTPSHRWGNRPHPFLSFSKLTLTFSSLLFNCIAPKAISAIVFLKAQFCHNRTQLIVLLQGQVELEDHDALSHLSEANSSMCKTWKQSAMEVHRPSVVLCQ